MQKDQQKLIELIKGKKVAFIGAGVSHKTLIKEFVELGAHVTLCDQKKERGGLWRLRCHHQGAGHRPEPGRKLSGWLQGSGYHHANPGLCGLL